MGKLRLREVKHIAQGSLVKRWWPEHAKCRPAFADSRVCAFWLLPHTPLWKRTYQLCLLCASRRRWFWPPCPVQGECGGVSGNISQAGTVVTFLQSCARSRHYQSSTTLFPINPKFLLHTEHQPLLMGQGLVMIGDDGKPCLKWQWQGGEAAASRRHHLRAMWRTSEKPKRMLERPEGK